MLSKLKIAIVLVIIAAVSGFLLWGANEITYEGIAAYKLEKERGYYREIFGLDQEATITFETFEINADTKEEIIIYDESGNALGYIYKGSENNGYGNITVLVGIKLDGTIGNVIISSNENTPTYAKKVDPDYLTPFIGQDSSDVTFDGTSGATFTYGSVSKFVTSATTYYNENRGAE